MRPARPMTLKSSLMLPILLGSLLACADPESTTEVDANTTGGDATDGDVSDEDVEVPEKSDYYSLTVALPSGVQQKFEGEILAQHISFGCTHLPPPVKSLAIELSYPKPYATLSINLGFVIGDEGEHPLTIEDVGEYAWGKGEVNAPPALKLITKDGPSGPQLTFASWVDGAEGTTSILQWGTKAGLVVEGRLSGVLKNEGRIDAKATIVGEFKLLLPIEEGCGGASSN